MGADPYAVLTAWLGGLAVGMSVVGYAMVRRERDRADELKRAEKRMRERW